MNQVKLTAVLDELLQSLRDSRACFAVWAKKSIDEELAAMFGERAQVLAQHEREIAMLLLTAGDKTCGAPELQIRVLKDRQRKGFIQAVGQCGQFSACEAEYARALMLYRDTLEYALPKEVYEVVARQFAALIDRHTVSSGGGKPTVAASGAQALALNPLADAASFAAAQ
jgi:hypothetical protein